MQDRIAYQGITFDDCLLEPRYSAVVPREVDVRTQLTRNIPLNIPLVSAPMDTVTESELAIALAQEGGIGIIHKNMSIEDQAGEVYKVKRSESGVITDPITLPPADVDELFRRTEATIGYRLSADLPNQTVSDDQGLKLHFDIDEFRKQVLLEGLDDIGLTLKHEAEITAHEKKHQPGAPIYERVDFKLFTAN